jgi:predicted GH43/DUF377 family glycosyl hydrolase
MLVRHSQNPILEPEPNNPWESFAVFNGTVTKKEDKVFMLYRAMGDELQVSGKKLRLSTIGIAESLDGINFSDRKPFLIPKESWEMYGAEDPRVTFIDGKYLVFYTALSSWPPNEKSIKVACAVSKDLKMIDKRQIITPFNAKAMVMFPEKIEGKYTVFLTVNSDMPPSHIACAQFEDFETLFDWEFWQNWYEHIDEHIIHLRRINSDQVEIGATPIKTDKGWLLIYSYIKHYLSQGVEPIFRIEAVLIDKDNPKKIIGRVERPLLIPEASYETQGQIKNIVFPEGAIIFNDLLNVYYGGADSVCAVASAKLEDIFAKTEINNPVTVKCQKFSYNPILEPIAKNDWESKAVFNPAVCELDNKVYILYRTTSKDNISNIGLAVSYDGYHIDERLDYPIYPLRATFELPYKAGAWGGAEDPRVTIIQDKIYMLYTAYDGILPKLSITSISISDFLSRDFDKWAYPKIISPPGVADKDGVLFSEKINGKYTFLHRIEPDIIIAQTDSLEFPEGSFLGDVGKISPAPGTWDAVKIGVNGPPLLTPEGYLVFYHGISAIDRHYRLGALLLDKNEVTKVLARAPYPILEPFYNYEKEGVVSNVVFPCGQILKNDKIIFYYGGADKVVCGAEIELSILLDYLIKSRQKQFLIKSLV